MSCVLHKWQICISPPKIKIMSHNFHYYANMILSFMFFVTTTQCPLNTSEWHKMAPCQELKQPLAPHGALWLNHHSQFLDVFSSLSKVQYGLSSGPRCLCLVSKDRVWCLAVYDTRCHPVRSCNSLWHPTAPYGFILTLSFSMAFHHSQKCSIGWPQVLGVCVWSPRTEYGVWQCMTQDGTLSGVVTAFGTLRRPMASSSLWVSRWLFITVKSAVWAGLRS